MKSKNTFQHGGDILSFCKEINAKQKDVIDLSSNINFLKPNIKIDFNKLDISAYPTYENLYEIIAKRYSIKADKIELFNGGSSAIFSFFRNQNLKHCTIYSPAYLEYKKAAKLFSYKTFLINRFKNINTKNIKKNSLVIFVNPSTPDGVYYDLEKLLKIWKKKNCTVLCDESFLDFTNKKSAIKYLKKYNNLYILKSMTKIYSSAGIRVGAIISKKKNIKALKKTEPLWKLSVFDSLYLQDSILDKRFTAKTVKDTKTIKRYTINKLQKIDFIEKIYKSEANYLLIKLKNISSNELQNRLKEYKTMIRDCSNFDYLDSSFIRIAIKNKKNMKYFINSLKEIKKDINNVS